MIKPIIVAFLFFSRLPMPRIETISAQDNGRALLFLPLVGLAVGLMIYTTTHLLIGQINSEILAALLLALWCALTGGLHLDGLADSADAWLSGANKDRSLEIMKDPRCGTAAIVTLICVLLVKFTAISAILENGQHWYLILIPVLGRTSALVLFLTTPYARTQGLSKDFSEYAPSSLIRILVIAIVLITTVSLGLSSALLVAAVSAVIFYAMRRLMLKRLGGSTGDTSGALIEVVEAGILIALV
jgi:adenosylcobinamide-GDP ribazoletransferase